MVHPQCRGYVHITVIIFNSVTKDTVLICALNCRSSFLAAHSTTGFPTLTKPSVHSAVEVVHALSWDLTLNPKETLQSSHHIISSHSFSITTSTLLHKFLFIKNALLQYHGLKNHGFPKNQENLQKEGLWPSPKAPKTILTHTSTYNLCTKDVKVPKLRTQRVQAPIGP